MRIFLVMFFMFLPSQVWAAKGKDAGAILAEAKSLRCLFQTAVETSWDGVTYQTRPQRGFSFKIEEINSAQGNAKAISQGGGSHLEMIALPQVRHFLGFTASGDLNVTSVHAQFGGNVRELLASHSVHMASEPPQTFQNFGNCRQILDEK